MAKKCGPHGCGNKLTADRQRTGDGEEFSSPTIIISSTSEDFGTQYAARCDGVKTYTVRGEALTDDITITSDSTKVEVSKDGGANYFSSVVLTQSGGSVPTTSIKIRYCPTTQESNSGTIEHTSTGATQQDLNWIGNAIFGDIIVDESALDFEDVHVGQNAVLSYNVSAVGLESDLTITSTNGKFLVSKDGGANYFASVTLNIDGAGSVPNTNIKVKYTPTAQQSDMGFINNSGNLAFTEGIQVDGVGLVQSTLYSENFDAAAVSGVPGAPVYKYPSNWTSPAGDPADPTTTEWQPYDDGGSYPPYSDDPGLGLPGSSGLRSLVFLNASNSTESVVSEPFSTIGLQDITLDLLQYRDIGTTVGLTLEWSDDNVIWNPLTFNDVFDQASWLNANTVNFPVGAENKATIYIRLTSTGDSSGLIMALDDLIVKGWS